MRSLAVTAADGATTVVEVYGSVGAPVLFLPGLGVPIGYYAPFLTAWAAHGFVVHALELRGMPQSSISDVRRHDFGYAHALDVDIPAVLAHTGIGTPFTIAGHSLGGQLSLLYAGRDRGDVAAVVAIASGSSHPSALPTLARRLHRRAQIGMIAGMARTLGHFPGDKVGFGGRQPRTMMADWAHEARTGQYLLAGSSADDEAGLADIHVPVFMITLDGDRLISPAAAALLGERAADAPLTALHLPRGEEPYDHFRWARRQPTVVADTVATWLRAALPET